MLKLSILRFLTFLSFPLLFLACIDPVEPEFQYEEDLLFIDAFASTLPGASNVTISETAVEFGVRVVNPVAGARVVFENTINGEEVVLTEAMNSYIVDEDFAIIPGEIWRLVVVLENGKRIESVEELVLDPVPIDDMQVNYVPELAFREIGGGKFVPGHRVTVNFNDPQQEDNYYYWSYRSFENLDYCKICIEGLFRDGDCIAYDLRGRLRRYFNYICETDCWQIRYPDNINIFNDQFTNGNAVTNLPVGDILLNTKENMVVELQQFSLTPSAFEYYKVLKDIVDNSSGLNAPPPAALIGNLFNPEDLDEVVLGRFTAAASSVSSVFVERESITQAPLETSDPIVLEPLIGSPYPPPATNFAPCEESKFRTAIEPNGWMDN
ncbi:DUF4249 domain-containing protein [Maribacter sp. CXY002]|uniref:DUF4249 domain-containing protein n=1 Tax=Maribacter luteocoastalis TaxID=3407671 RepID=UPI003B67BE6F